MEEASSLFDFAPFLIGINYEWINRTLLVWIKKVIPDKPPWSEEKQNDPKPKVDMFEHRLTPDYSLKLVDMRGQSQQYIATMILKSNWTITV